MGRGRAAGASVARDVRAVLRLVVLVAVVLLVANVGTRSFLLLRLAPRVATLQASVVRLERLHAGLVDEETGLRGYLASGDPVFLEPYRRAQPVVQDALDGLARNVGAGQAGVYLLALEQARQRWVDGWATPSATRPATAGSLPAVLLSGKTLFDDYRAAHDRLDEDLRRSIDAAQREQDAWLLWSGVLQGAIALAVVVAAVFARGWIGRRVTAPLAVVTAGVRRIAAGHLATEVEPGDAPVELAALAADINAMAATMREQIDLAELQQRESEERGRRLAVVLDAAREIAGSLSLRYVMASVADATTALGADRVRIWLLADDGHDVVVAYDSAAGPGGPQTAAQVPVGTSVVGRAVKYGRPAGPEPLAETPAQTVAVPLLIGGRVVGAIECCTDAVSLSPDELEIVGALALHAAAAVEAARLHEHTAHVAVTDALTDLPNRRAFDAEFEAEVARSLRYERPLSVISVDLDHFKQLNDRYGHAYGDIALQQVAGVLRSGVRDIDRVYRMGGEEILVVLAETPLPAAADLAERLCSAVASSAGPGAPLVTASFGVAELPASATNGGELLAAADRALYAAKEAGRNRVVVAAPPVVVPHQTGPVVERRPATPTP